MAAYAVGAVLVVGDDPAAALPELRRACSGYLELEMPYEAARTRVLVATALRAVGDRDAAALELDAAQAAFERLGAGPDLARTGPRAVGAAAAGVLSERERDVLGHVAAGETNREVAAALSISEHTVARHVQNIFTKLGVTSRAAATAYAYEHGLL
jgi:DNA-binding NarL/FixJ family response regulator